MDDKQIEQIVKSLGNIAKSLSMIEHLLVAEHMESRREKNE